MNFVAKCASTNVRRRTVNEVIGEAVQVEAAWGESTVAYRPGLGWVMEVCPVLRNEPAWRWPLPAGLTAVPCRGGPAPALDVDRVADVVAVRAAMSIDQLIDAEATLREEWSFNSPDLRELAHLGYRVPVEWAYGTEEGPDVVIVKIDGDKTVGRRLLTRKVGELYGVRTPVVVLARAGFTRDAIVWADSVDIALSSILVNGACAQSKNSRAAAGRTVG